MTLCWSGSGNPICLRRFWKEKSEGHIIGNDIFSDMHKIIHSEVTGEKGIS